MAIEVVRLSLKEIKWHRTSGPLTWSMYLAEHLTNITEMVNRVRPILNDNDNDDE